MRRSEREARPIAYRDGMGWTPILDGELAQRARQAVLAITREYDTDPDPSPSDSAMFWAYAAGALDDEASNERYAASVEQLGTSLTSGGAQRIALYGGLSGATWVLAHITDDDDGEHAPLDEAIFDALRRDMPWTGDYDLIAGLSGIAVMYLERLRAGSARATAALAHVVFELDQLAVRDGDAITWFTPVALLPRWQAETAPEGYFNFGVAHGVPGTIAVLARIATADGVEATTRDRARSLAVGALRWVERRLLPPNPRGRIPSWIPKGHTTAAPGRSAWCYGEPGAAVACWTAARRLGVSEEPWRTLALDSANREPELCGILDAGLCHGALGLAHLYNRAFQASGDPAFRDAARAWIERGLEMRIPNGGIGGFIEQWSEGAGKPLTQRTTSSFLTGAGGIGLALLASLGTEEPGWDRLLACDF